MTAHMKDPIQDLGGFIRQQREKSAISVRKLAEIAGISNPYLSQIERGLRKPSAEILKSLANALSIRAEYLYEKAGLLDGDVDSNSVASAIESDHRLTKPQKQALTRVYESFISAQKEQK